MLSDKDLESARVVGSFAVFPFVPSSLSPVGYSLGVGDEALYLRKGIAHRKVDVKKEGKIIIEAQDTVAIRTRERVRLSKELGGVLYAKVSSASRGLFHVAAAVHPGWGIASPEGEHFLVYVHNYSDEPQVLVYEEPFCTLCLSKMESPAEGSHCRESARREEWLKLQKGATLTVRAKEKARRTGTIVGAFILVGVMLGVTISGIFPQTWGGVIGGLAALFGAIWAVVHS